MYTAINIDVFVAAYSGAIGGFINQQRTIARSSAEYARLCQQALAFAEEFDTLYASVMPNILQIANIESATSEYFNGYSPPGGNPSITATNYVESAQNIINILSASDTLVAANVTNSIPAAGGGGGGGTLAGDVVGPLLTNKIEQISGNAGTVIVNANEFFWNELSSPLFQQFTRVGDLPAHDFIVAPQAPSATASPGLNRAPGSFVVQIATPGSGGANGTLRVEVAGNIEVQLGAYPGAPTLGSIWLGQVAVPTAVNYAIAGDGTTQLSINGPAGGGIYMGIGNGATMAVFTDRLAFTQTQAALIQLDPRVGDHPTFDLNIAGQAPFVGGANTSPGNVIVTIAAPDGAGTYGYFKVHNANLPAMTNGLLAGFPQYGIIWLGTTAGAPGGGNYAVLSDGSDTFINGTNSARFAINGAPKVVVATNTSTFFTDVRAGTTGLDINLFRNIGDITNSIFFAHDASAPVIYQATATSDVPTANLSLISQAPNAGATINLNSGKLIFQTAAPVGAGLPGFIETYLGATLASRYRKSSGAGGGVFTVYDNGLATDAVVAVHQDDDSPYSMRFYNDTFSASSPVMSYYATGGGFWEFVLEAANKAMTFSTGGFSLHRLVLTDDQATFPTTGVVISTINGTSAFTNQLFVNSGGSPSNPQIKVEANSLGAMTMHCFAADNSFLTYDCEFTGGSFIARDTTASLIYKAGGALHLYGNSGLTPGNGYGPTDRWALDLATGNVTMNGQQLTFSMAVTTPSIYQVDQTANAVDGTSLSLQAQNSTGTGTRGGSLFLKAGTGTSIQGQIFMYGSLNLSGTDGNPRIFISGATISFEAGQTPFFIQEDLTTNGATGHLMTVRAQNETGTTSTGGSLLLASGTGTSTDGDVRVSPLGSTSSTYFVFTHVSTALQLTASATASSMNFYVTGTQIMAFQALGSNSNIYYDATTHHWRSNVGTDVMLLTGSGFVTSMEFALDAAVTITQATSAPVTDAQQFIIRAAKGGAGGGSGGDLVLASGENDGGADGGILFSTGASLQMSIALTEVDFYNGMGTIFFQNSVATDILIKHLAVSGNAHNFKIEAQTSSAGNGTGGYMLLGGGADNATHLTGGVRLYIDGDATNGIMLEMGDVIAGKRILSLLKGTVLTSTQMPANTGDLVAFWANAATAPTTGVPVGGVIPFAEGGQWKYVDTSGTTVTL